MKFYLLSTLTLLTTYLGTTTNLQSPTTFDAYTPQITTASLSLEIYEDKGDREGLPDGLIGGGSRLT